MADDTPTRISRNIRLMMVTLDLKQAELANRSGISESHLSRLLSGRRGWDLKNMEAVAKALGISTPDLFAEAEDLLRSRCFSAGYHESYQPELFSFAA
jgi:transcriptional regulator with XRE-family HTH domain